MIGIDGDNIQVFEYDSAKTAQKEAYALAAMYQNANKDLVMPEKNEHVYLKDKLVIFYLGNDEFIHSGVTELPLVMVSNIQSGKYNFQAARRIDPLMAETYRMNFR